MVFHSSNVMAHPVGPLPVRRRRGHLYLVGGTDCPSESVRPTTRTAGPRPIADSPCGIRLVHTGYDTQRDNTHADGDLASTPLGYTVGLTGLGEPELVMRHADFALATEILSRWANAVAHGQRLVAGDVLCGGLNEPHWRLQTLDSPSDTLLWTAHYYRRPRWPELHALELVPATAPFQCLKCH